MEENRKDDLIPEEELPETETPKTETPEAETPEVGLPEADDPADETIADETRSAILERIADANGEKTRKPARKSSRRGMYTAAVSAVVIVIVIIFNLIVGQLPSNLTEIDITGYRLYNVSTVSRNFLRELKDDIEIVVIAQEGAVDERIMKFIHNYAAESPHIKLTEIDPVTHPSALETYGAEDNEVVVINKATDKQTTVQIQGFDGADSAMILYDYQTYYTTHSLQATRLDADSQLTSAINIVTGTGSGKICTVTNHGESALSGAIGERLKKLNLEQEELDLLLTGAIPEDCSVLVINNPRSDMTAEELSVVSSYLRDGGDVLLLLDDPSLENFNALLLKYGLQMQNGMVGDESKFYQTYAQYYGYYCIAPGISTVSPVTSSISSNALLLYPRGMVEVTPERRGSSLDIFLTTSEKGFLMVDEDNIIRDQTYILGAAASEAFDTNSDGTTDYTSHLTVISAANMIDENLTSTMTSISNLDIFMNALTGNIEGVSTITVPSKSLKLTYNTLQNVTIFGVLFIGVIPLVLIIGGLVNWTRRRKK